MLAAQLTDADLIAATARGDRAAFATLVERHQRAIYRLARALVRDPQAAEDVLQETFLAALRAAPSYRAEAPVTSWLYAIARHIAYRMRRRASEVAVDDASLERLGVEAGWGTADVERAAVRAQQHAHLAAALAALAPDERELLTMRDGLGLSGEETAAALGLSLAAMKSRLHRARLRVAGKLREKTGGHDGAP